MAKPCVRNALGSARGAASGAASSQTPGFAAGMLHTATGRRDSRRQREERGAVGKCLDLAGAEGEGESRYPRELQIHHVSVHTVA
jgi:hypothetical protein